VIDISSSNVIVFFILLSLCDSYCCSF